MNGSARARATVERSLLPERATASGTHRRLLEEALILFGERGFHGVSVREIAEAAGVRASSIYAHLESKEQLLFQLISLGHEEHRDRIRAALLESSADPADQIRHLIHAHVLMHTELPLLARVANRELHALAPELRTQVQAVRDDAIATALRVIERGTAMGVFHVDDTWLAAAAIFAPALRIAEWWDDQAAIGDALGLPVDYTAEQVAERYATFAVRMLTSQQS